MGKSAVPAPDNKVPATDGHVMRAGDMAVPACGRLDKFPEIITANLRELSFLADILDPGNEDPGGPAVVTDHPGLVRHSGDDLVSIRFTMVTHRAIPGNDEMIAHGR